jgi:hypothetical protein
VYITDNTRVRRLFGWTPTRTVDDIARDLHEWVRANDAPLRATLT